jgi:hypothetical protein
LECSSWLGQIPEGALTAKESTAGALIARAQKKRVPVREKPAGEIFANKCDLIKVAN